MNQSPTRKLFTRSTRLLVSVAAVGLLSVGCSSMYYSTMDALGFQKREILLDRVKEARNSQSVAKEQFESALDRFMSVVEVDGGELEETYQQLKSQYEQSKAKAEDVNERISSVESVAEALFNEWEDELQRYSNDDLRQASERKLQQTRRRYKGFIAAMRRAESKMDPVLQAFQDQVLFLKHNLNARVIASLKGDTAQLQSNVSQLVEEMEQSIEEANRFIDSMDERG